MKRWGMVRSLIAGTLVMLATAAAGAEQTVTLAVDNMSCESCPYIVEKSLKRVKGVIDATVSFEKRTASVRFEDSRTGIDALTRATAEAGYPSRIAE